MTIKEAWYEIFLAFATPRKKRNKWQLKLTGLDKDDEGSGICCAICELVIKGKITKDKEEYIMYDLISLQNVNSYFYPLSPENDRLRACYCYFEYLDAEGV